MTCRNAAFVFALCPAFMLAACGEGSQPANPAEGGEQATSLDEGSVTGAPGQIASPAEQNAAGNGRFSSHYTSLDLDECELVSQQTEGEGATWRCAGLDGMDLIVMSGDGRMDIDAGADNSAWESIGAFNAEPATVEWRMADSAPVAIIYRLSDVSMQSAGRSVLMIETPGAEGCLIGRVSGDTPSANARARRIADDAAEGFACGEDEPQNVGDTA
ncbi:hypothetical protein PF049_03205 [Erythrobacteraceae bacterium WH01K]|nr:hypothetical protein PF049_03205 [Erythrobacteraceae bacterium WH01K]